MSFTNITVINKLTKNIIDFDHTLLKEDATLYHLINLIKHANPTTCSCTTDVLVYCKSIPSKLIGYETILEDNTIYEIEVLKPTMNEIKEYNLQSIEGTNLITPNIKIDIEDGSEYIGDGCTVNGKVVPHGKGTSTGKDYIYTGMWFYGRKEGQGVATYPSGMVREGNFMNDKINNGTESHLDGYIYIGSFYDNFRHGKGKDIYPDGSIVEGYYADDEFIRGIIKYPNGIVEEGEFLEDNLVKGIRTNPDRTVDIIK
jgi:hypothetical protein